jgi:O-antigen ligase
MKGFFLLLEISLPLLAIYWVVRKQALAIVYVPVIMFSHHIIETKLPGFFYYFYLTLLLIYLVVFNLPFIKKNIFSIIIFIYFLILLKDYPFEFNRIRPYMVNISWVFLGIGLIPYIYEKYDREKIFKEISLSALLTMIVFSLNTILSTIFKYNPREAYGITSGILFGNISNDYYNIFPLALFLILRRAIKEKNLVFFVVFFVGLCFVLLTLRRSVMLLSVIAIIIVMIELLDFKNIKQFVIYGFFLAIVSIVIITQTSFMDQLIERIEGRGLAEKKLGEEGRIMEFTLLYKDLFVYYDYDPWFGFGLDQSHGNYGKKIYGTRSLHTDIAHLIHSSGFLGLFLYLMMVGLAFLMVWRKTKSKDDRLQFYFIVICFSLYFINGRYTTANAMIMMFGILNLPLGKTPKIERSLVSELKPEEVKA